MIWEILFYPRALNRHHDSYSYFCICDEGAGWSDTDTRVFSQPLKAVDSKNSWRRRPTTGPTEFRLTDALALVVIHRRIVDKHTYDLANIDDCLDAPINRRLNVGVEGLACQDHALGQVAGSDVEYFDVVNGHDLLQAVYGDDILEENGNQSFVVGLVNLVLHAVTLTTSSRAAMPNGAVFGGVHHSAGVFNATCGTMMPCAPRSNVR